MGQACTKAGREEAAFLKAVKDGDCTAVQQASRENWLGYWPGGEVDSQRAYAMLHHWFSIYADIRTWRTRVLHLSAPRCHMTLTKCRKLVERMDAPMLCRIYLLNSRCGASTVPVGVPVMTNAGGVAPRRVCLQSPDMERPKRLPLVGSLWEGRRTGDGGGSCSSQPSGAREMVQAAQVRAGAAPCRTLRESLGVRNGTYCCT